MLQYLPDARFFHGPDDQNMNSLHVLLVNKRQKKLFLFLKIAHGKVWGSRGKLHEFLTSALGQT